MITKGEIMLLRAQRLTYQEIGKRLGVSRQRIHQVLKDYTAMLPSLRKTILTRDNFQCHTCGTGKNLEVHHINGTRSDNREVNLLTFCRKHHLELEAAARADGLKEITIRMGNKIRVLREKRICPICKKDFEARPKETKVHCSEQCYQSIFPEVSDEERKKKASQLSKAWYKSHKEYVRERKKNMNQDEVRKYYRKYYQKNKEKIADYQRERYKIPEVRERLNKYQRERWRLKQGSHPRKLDKNAITW